MNKGELVDAIASSSDISKAQAERALNAVTDAISNTLKKGEKLTLVGFGTFAVNDKSARKGRNPQTGAEINIPARKVAKFKAGSKLTEIMNE